MLLGVGKGKVSAVLLHAVLCHHCSTWLSSALNCVLLSWTPGNLGNLGRPRHLYRPAAQAWADILPSANTGPY